MVDIMVAIAPLAVANIAFFTLIYTMFKEQAKGIAQQHETSKSIENQVKNSHNINLRDDLDDKHSEVVEMFRMLNHRFEIVDKTQINHQAHIDKLWGRVNGLTRREHGDDR